MSSESSRIMAGTRVWPDHMHLGTFFGWIEPLRNLSFSNEVYVLIADVQSIENFPSYNILMQATRSLKDEICSFLPRAKVYVESELDGFDKYSVQAASLFKNEYYRRLGPFKNIGTEKRVTSLKSLYPTMMIADVLILRPDQILAKNGNQSPHIDVINDVLKRGRSSFGWPNLHVGILGKEPIYIPDVTGDAPMRRSSPDKAITISFGMTAKEIEQALYNTNYPGTSGPDISVCKVIAPIWEAALREIGGKASCAREHANCISCIRSLSQRISEELTP